MIPPPKKNKKKQLIFSHFFFFKEEHATYIFVLLFMPNLSWSIPLQFNGSFSSDHLPFFTRGTIIFRVVVWYSISTRVIIEWSQWYSDTLGMNPRVIFVQHFDSKVRAKVILYIASHTPLSKADFQSPQTSHFFRVCVFIFELNGKSAIAYFSTSNALYSSMAVLILVIRISIF